MYTWHSVVKHQLELTNHHINVAPSHFNNNMITLSKDLEFQRTGPQILVEDMVERSFNNNNNNRRTAAAH